MTQKPKETEPKPILEINDVYSPKFESKMDDYFKSKAKEKDTWSRRASIKLYGKWT